MQRQSVGRAPCTVNFFLQLAAWGRFCCDGEDWRVLYRSVNVCRVVSDKVSSVTFGLGRTLLLIKSTIDHQSVVYQY